MTSKKYMLYKRFLDIVGSVTLIVILAPVFIFLYVLTFFFMRNPVFFSQVRLGKSNKIFLIYKFRTMLQLTDDSVPNEKNRLTPFGRLLRRSSLDELPQLFNILKGEMSFIGPRPLLPEYLPYYQYFEKKRHNVLPGLTGLSQVKGRNTLSWKKKLAYDVYYVRKISFLLDLKILLMTLCTVITQSGINSSENLSMPRLDLERSKKNDKT